MARRAQARRRALMAAHGRCPRCSAAREAGQRYCLECGLALPALDGRLAWLRGAWIRRLGWYPGDFVWATLAAGLIAAAAGAASIAVQSSRAGRGPETVVAPVPATVAPTPAAEPDGRTQWPPGQSGWTVVIESLPASGGVRPARSLAAAAVAAGLPQVGVLASGRYPSLLPGYDVVFSGVYSTESQAATALRTVLTRGYAGAYTAQIAT